MSTTLEIETLYKALQDKLGLVWLAGEQYKNRTLHSSADTSADISLVGYLNLITLHRVQVLGRKEMEYLDSLKKNSRKDSQKPVSPLKSFGRVLKRFITSCADPTAGFVTWIFPGSYYQEPMQSLTRRRMKLIKSFCGGPGGGFFKKSPLAAGGKKRIFFDLWG
jgi:hypothetical protein